MMMLCPRCNTMVPENEYSHHMRIELLDPKFSEQRKQLEERKKEAPLAADDDIVKNLDSFSKRRTGMCFPLSILN